MRNVATALVPASATTRLPPASKVTANGTAPGSGVTTGVRDRPPSRLTAKTSMALPLPLVVTTSWEPSGVNATCPGVWVNSGSCVGSSPSGRFHAGMRMRKSPTRK